MNGTITCKVCGETVPRRVWNQRDTCGSQRCKDMQKRKRQTRSVVEIARNRERNAKWCAEHRGVKERNPWLIGAPPFSSFLPGRGVGIQVLTRLRFPLDVRNARLVHALVTACIGKPHPAHAPGFSLVPWSGGLGVYVHGEDWQQIAGQTVGAAIADQPVQVRFGPVWRMLAPKVRRGHQRVRVTSYTPVVWRNSGARYITDVTAEHIIASLRGSLAERLGASVRTEDLRVEVLGETTEIVRTDLGGKYGAIPGWRGTVDLEVNAPARWLLECAARGWGLGGKTAFGFGRVSVNALA